MRTKNRKLHSGNEFPACLSCLFSHLHQAYEPRAHFQGWSEMDTQRS